MSELTKLPRDHYLRVTKSNDLIEASYKFTLNENRLILACIAKLDSRKPMPSGHIRIRAEDFAETFGVPLNKSYEYLKEATDRLYERDIKTYDGKIKERFRWVDHVKYYEGLGYVELRFTIAVAPYITSLHRRFTSYQLGRIAYLNSPYAIRLYEMLQQYRDIGKREFELEAFKERLVLTEKYQRFSNLKARVIDPAIDDINKKTDLMVSWKAIREGRRVVRILFTFVPQKQMSLDLDPDILPAEQSAAEFVGDRDV